MLAGYYFGIVNATIDFYGKLSSICQKNKKKIL